MRCKEILFLLFFALCSAGAFAQLGVGLRLLQTRPIGNSPILLGNTISGELNFDSWISYDGRVRGRATIGFIPYNIRFPEMPTYAVQQVGNNVTVFDGTLTQEKFNVTYVTVGLDVNIINGNTYRLYVGADGSVGTYRSVFTSDIPGISSSDSDVGYVFYGFRARAGMAYKFFDVLDLFLESNYNRYMYEGIGWFPTMDVGFGLRYEFD